jgi:hypothetical protein
VQEKDAATLRLLKKRRSPFKVGLIHSKADI